ncbi:hypothetical protein N7486_000048 [Penicillium sp. IBT 16267x]|nr:hypothetical protein N7486_000048 [Penicillium sp. IBT 16267x]
MPEGPESAHYPYTAGRGEGSRAYLIYYTLDNIFPLRSFVPIHSTPSPITPAYIKIDDVKSSDFKFKPPEGDKQLSTAGQASINEIIINATSD